MIDAADRPARARGVAVVLGLVLLAATSRPAAPAPAGSETRARLAEGDALLRRGAYNSARQVLTEALRLAHDAADRSAEVDLLGAIARVDDHQSDATAAATDRDRALDLARALGDRRREASLLTDAGMAQARRAQPAEARRSLEAALRLEAPAGSQAGEAGTRIALGYLAYKEGRYDEAIVETDRALAMATAVGDLTVLIDAHLQTGLIHQDRRDFVAALAADRAALRAAEAIGDVERQVGALDQMAIAYLFQEAPTEARVRLDQALDLARRHDDLPLEMRVRHLIGNSLRQAGRLREALAEYDLVGAWFEAEGDRAEAGWIRFRRGKAEEALGRLEEAERSWRAALGMWDAIGERRAAAWVRYEMARLDERLGRTEAAVGDYEAAIAAARAISLPFVSLPLGDLGLLQARAGRAAPAVLAADAAVADATAVANPEMLWRALYRRGQVSRLLRRPVDALDSFRAGLDVIEAMRHRVAPSDEAKAGFMMGRQEVYAAAVNLLVEMGRPGEALEISERARARAFLDLVGGDREQPPAPGPGTRDGHQGDGGDDDGGGEDDGAAPVDPSAAALGTPAPATRAALVTQAATRGPAAPPAAAPAPAAASIPSRLYVPPLPLDGIRAEARRRHATLLEYFTAADRSFVFLVAPDGVVRSGTIMRGAAELAASIATLRRALAAGEPATAALRDLHDLLIGPVAGALPRDPEALVVVVPHGALALLPFAALADTEGRFFVERHTLAAAPAAGFLKLAAARPRRRDAAARSLLAVGNPLTVATNTAAPPLAPLPGAEAEARAVAAAFGGRDALLLLGREATEARVRRQAPTRGILHFATHALVDDADPLGGRLLLTPVGVNPADDGMLTAVEVAGLHLTADLVTLSACDSGLGDDRGEGVGSLARAFLHAGAATLVVSLWRLADDAARFQMERFYRAHAAGPGPAAALRRAQIDTLEALRRGALRDPAGRPLAPSPAFWAPLIVLGEPG